MPAPSPDPTADHPRAAARRRPRLRRVAGAGCANDASGRAIRAGGAIEVGGQAPIVMGDDRIVPPSTAGVVTVDDNGVVRARAGADAMTASACVDGVGGAGAAVARQWR